MDKKNVVKMDESQEDPVDFDFSSMDATFDEEAFDMGRVVLESLDSQMNLALQLTKLVVEQTPGEMNKDQIFSTFKEASGIILEMSTLKKYLEPQ